ncbi:MAG TPA: hypothetical protein VF503_11380 [Sphingobium sp.]|uniref:hypothetical protein n=1 Tax=Sphingobium sp. TaxID=1912891 RepID=UPI002ED61685
MKYLLIPFIALGISSAAYATTYPPCSKTVRDECMNTGSHHMKSSKAHMHHKAAHHSASEKMEKSTKS